MEIIKRKAEGKLKLVRAIKGVHPLEEDGAETRVLLMYVDRNHDPAKALCTAGVVRVIENKRSSNATGVPITRKPNTRMFLEVIDGTVHSVYVVPIIDTLYLASRKSAEGEPIGEEYILKVDKDTGSIIVEETPGTAKQKDVDSLVKALSTLSTLEANKTVAEKWVITFVKGSKCTVEPV